MIFNHQVLLASVLSLIIDRVQSAPRGNGFLEKRDQVGQCSASLASLKASAFCSSFIGISDVVETQIASSIGLATVTVSADACTSTAAIDISTIISVVTVTPSTAYETSIISSSAVELLTVSTSVIVQTIILSASTDVETVTPSEIFLTSTALFSPAATTAFETRTATSLIRTSITSYPQVAKRNVEETVLVAVATITPSPVFVTITETKEVVVETTVATYEQIPLQADAIQRRAPSPWGGKKQRGRKQQHHRDNWDKSGSWKGEENDWEDGSDWNDNGDDDDWNDDGNDWQGDDGWKDNDNDNDNHWHGQDNNNDGNDWEHSPKPVPSKTKGAKTSFKGEPKTTSKAGPKPSTKSGAKTSTKPVVKTTSKLSTKTGSKSASKSGTMISTKPKTSTKSYSKTASIKTSVTKSASKTASIKTSVTKSTTTKSTASAVCTIKNVPHGIDEFVCDVISSACSKYVHPMTRILSTAVQVSSFATVTAPASCGAFTPSSYLVETSFITPSDIISIVYSTIVDVQTSFVTPIQSDFQTSQLPEVTAFVTAPTQSSLIITTLTLPTPTNTVTVTQTVTATQTVFVQGVTPKINNCVDGRFQFDSGIPGVPGFATVTCNSFGGNPFGSVGTSFTNSFNDCLNGCKTSACDALDWNILTGECIFYDGAVFGPSQNFAYDHAEIEFDL